MKRKTNLSTAKSNSHGTRKGQEKAETDTPFQKRRRRREALCGAVQRTADGPQQERPEGQPRSGKPGGRKGKLQDSPSRREERELVPEIRQKFEHSRKLHQEFLEPAQGADTLPPSAHDLQRLQTEQAGNQGPGGRQTDGRSEGVPQALRNPPEKTRGTTKYQRKRKRKYGKKETTGRTAATATAATARTAHAGGTSGTGHGRTTYWRTTGTRLSLQREHDRLGGAGQGRRIQGDA